MQAVIGLIALKVEVVLATVINAVGILGALVQLDEYVGKRVVWDDVVGDRYRYDVSRVSGDDCMPGVVLIDEPGQFAPARAGRRRP